MFCLGFRVCPFRKLINVFVITRLLGLRFRQNMSGIIPTSLPEIPIQLRDLRDNQKYVKTYFILSLYPLCLVADHNSK